MKKRIYLQANHGPYLGRRGDIGSGNLPDGVKRKKGLPVHCRDGVRDEEMPFSPVDLSGHATPSICMSNSFGFGGCNVSLILGRLS